MEGPLLEIDQAGKRHYLKLSDAPVTIGRHPTNVLVVTDELASRFHCVIERYASGFVVRDLKSKNGTKLNNNRVDTAELQPGDEVRIGETVVRLLVPKVSGSGRMPPVGGSGAMPRSAGNAPAPQPRGPAAPPPIPASANNPSTLPVVPPQGPPARSPLVAGADVDATQVIPPVKSTPFDDNAPLPMFSSDPPSAQPKRVGVQIVRSEPQQMAPGPGSAGNAGAPGSLPGRSPERARMLSGKGKAPQAAGSVQATLPADHIRALRDIAANLPDKSVEEHQIAMVNSRAQILHPAGVEATDGDLLNVEVLRTLRLILTVCFRIRASDVHFEPKQDDTQVRMRVDGMMVEICRMHPSVAQRLNNMIKILCDIEVTGRATIQEGHFSAKLPNRRVDFRISFTPAVNGQKLVIRVLDMGWAPQHLEALNLPHWMFETIRNIARQDAGMLLVCGPTGSGKTTTLYSCIRDLDIAQRNVVTIEDPVEYQIDGVTQIPINSDQGNTFSGVLRSVLRQDPDVILVGEIRDSDTAKIAMQASMTGHMVMSTVHAKDTLGTVFRLLDLGIEPYLIASALNIVLAQRLIRVLCPKCKAESRPTSQQQMKMGRSAEGLSRVYLPEGCKACLQTGYFGRRGIFEMLHVNEEIRDVILKSPTLQDLKKALRNTVFLSLAETGYRLVAEGVTSYDEIERVCGTEG